MKVRSVETDPKQRANRVAREEPAIRARAAALEPPGYGIELIDRGGRAMSRQERGWEAEHGEGQVTEATPDHLILWNFDVNGGELKAEHLAALDRMRDRARIAFLAGGVELQIEGHASRTGLHRENDRLAIMRANAAFNYLVDRGVDGARCNLQFHASDRPWLPNVTGRAMAMNRRVELRLTGQSSAPSPEPRPIPEPPSQRRPRDPEQPELTFGEVLPSASVEFQKEFDPKYPVAVGPYVLCWPSVQISGKYKMKTERGASLALKFGAKGATTEFKHKLNDLTDFKVDSAGKIGFGFKGDILDSEIVWDTMKALKGAPISYNVSRPFKMPDYEWPHGSGVRWAIDFEIKGKFAFGPSPLALAQLGLGTGAAGAATEGVTTGVAALGAAEMALLGVGVVGLATVPLTIKYTAEAHEKGEQNARLFARHGGFALRLAGEATGEAGYREAFRRLDDYRGQQYYEDRYDGWQDAEAVLAAVDAAAKERLVARGRKHGQGGIDPFVMELLWAARAFDFAPIPTAIPQLKP